MVTTWTERQPINSVWTARPKSTIWIDYLLDDTWEQILDDTSDPISIYSTSWYEQIDNGTQRTKRTSI